MEFQGVVKSIIMGSSVPYRFGDLMVCGAEHDEYLTNSYGVGENFQYKKRATHYDYVECALEKTYLDA